MFNIVKNSSLSSCVLGLAILSAFSSKGHAESQMRIRICNSVLPNP